MSFSFTVIGSRDDAAAQLAQVNTYGSTIGTDIAALIRGHLTADTASLDTAPGFRDHHLVYTIRASGHSGGTGSLSLNVTVTSDWVRNAMTEMTITV